jgi:hypothetical protein
MWNLQSNDIRRLFHAHVGFRYVQMDGEICQFWSDLHSREQVTKLDKAITARQFCQRKIRWVHTHDCIVCKLVVEAILSPSLVYD